MNRFLFRFLFRFVLVLAGTTACVDPDPGALPDDHATDTRQLVEVQPSCVPDPGDDGDGHDDGAACDDHTAGPDVVCTIVPHPYLYCVTCSDGSSECSSYPSPPET